MTATANEEDRKRSRAYLGDMPVDAASRARAIAFEASLAREFAAVRAPLEARIAELEAEKLRGAFAMLGESPKLALAHKRIAELEADLATIERLDAGRAANRMRGELAAAREAALREAAEVCKQAAMGASYNEHERAAAFFRAESLILALIETPAVKP